MPPPRLLSTFTPSPSSHIPYVKHMVAAMGSLPRVSAMPHFSLFNISSYLRLLISLSSFIFPRYFNLALPQCLTPFKGHSAIKFKVCISFLHWLARPVLRANATRELRLGFEPRVYTLQVCRRTVGLSEQPFFATFCFLAVAASDGKLHHLILCCKVELEGLEPSASCLQNRHSPN